MFSLVIDTSQKQQYIGIYKNNILINSISEETQNSHLEIIHENLKKLLEETNVTYNEFEKVIVVNGPGSFTGVRIGLMVAKVIACEFKIPLFTISSLLLLSTSHLDKSTLKVKFSKIKNYVINYKVKCNKIVEYEQLSQIDKNDVTIEMFQNYDNIFSHSYLLKEESYLDVEPNYIETPNYVKKLKN